MKKTSFTILFTLSLFATAIASSPKTSAAVDWNKAEKNYIAALTSDNAGLRKSAANFIAEYRLNGAVLSLIDVLRTDKVEQLRMAAALALVQLGNKEGIDAVQEATMYDGSEKVAKFCEQLLRAAATETISLK